MKIASQILEDFSKFQVQEGKAHTHVPEERADLFQCYGTDPASTEREYVELIYSLIRVMKPGNILELGTGMGLTALIMAAAAKENAYGKVSTVDVRYLESLRILAGKYGLFLNISMCSSLEFLTRASEAQAYAQPVYDFVMFDTIQKDKGKDAMFMLDCNLLKPSGILVFHDTSSLRFKDAKNPDASDQGYLDDLLAIAGRYDVQRLDFPLSRGLTVMRYMGEKHENKNQVS